MMEAERASEALDYSYILTRLVTRKKNYCRLKLLFTGKITPVHYFNVLTKQIQEPVIDNNN
jgi:hypothetical protein